MNTPTPAEHLLEAAIRITNDRRSNYGPPLEHFARTVGMVNALFAHKLREPLTVADWAAIMLCDKLARHQGTTPTIDTIVDLAGYAACMYECGIAGQHDEAGR